MEIQVEQPEHSEEQSQPQGSKSEFKVLGLRLSKNQQPWYNYNRPDIQEHVDEHNNTQ